MTIEPNLKHHICSGRRVEEVVRDWRSGERIKLHIYRED